MKSKKEVFTFFGKLQRWTFLAKFGSFFAQNLKYNFLYISCGFCINFIVFHFLYSYIVVQLYNYIVLYLYSLYSYAVYTFIRYSFKLIMSAGRPSTCVFFISKSFAKGSWLIFVQKLSDVIKIVGNDVIGKKMMTS